MKGDNWKRRFYNRYLSSGQSEVQSFSAEKAFLKEGPYLKHVIQSFFPEDKKISIIDLGCGRGGFVYHLQQFGYKNVKGYDVSQEQLDYARQLGLNNIFEGDIIAVAGSLKTNSVDVIILFDVIEHLQRPLLLQLLDEVYRILKPEGKVLVHAPNAQGIFGNAVRYGDLTHETAFTSSSLRQLFKGTGFTKIDCREDKPLLYSFKSFLRRVIWEAMTLQFRMIHLAETGSWTAILSRNLLAIIEK